jgi:hypothetical protein
MKQYAVIHCQKGKGSGGGQGKHIDREVGFEHTFQQVDPTRRILNREFAEDKFTSISMPEAIALRVQEGYTSSRAIRADTVRYVDTIFSGSHEQMKQLEKDGDITQWVKKTKTLAEELFGKENIVRFTLHMDERTPHIHCVFVPLTKDGRLSAKEILDKKSLSLFQDRYGELMKPFGFERGEKGSLATHDTPKEFYGRTIETSKQVENLTVKGIFGIDKDKTIENLKKALKSTEIVKKANEHKLEVIEKRVSFKMQGENISLQRKVNELEKSLQETKVQLDNHKKFINAAIKNPELLELEKNRREELIEKNKQKAELEQAKKNSRNTGFRR